MFESMKQSATDATEATSQFLSDNAAAIAASAGAIAYVACGILAFKATSVLGTVAYATACVAGAGTMVAGVAKLAEKHGTSRPVAGI